MSKIKVGVIGAGGISSGVHLPLLSCINNVSIEFIADTVNPEIQKKLTMKKMMQAISSLKNEEAFYSSDFSYESIPGPFLRGLNNTKELLKNYNLEVFQ